MRVWRLRASIVFSALLFLYCFCLVEVVYTRIPDPYPIVVSCEVSLFTITITAYYYCLLYPCLFFFFSSIFQRWVLESL